MQEMIKAIFEALQTLEIQSTVGNVQIMNRVFAALNDLYQNAQKPEEKEDDKE